MTALQGLRALVTAGASGIGRRTAQMLAGAGARVMVCDVAEDLLAEFRASRPDIPATRADVADEPAVDALFEAVAQQLGGLDILVNNAGVAGPTGPVEALTLADWQRTFDVNVTGQFLCARRAVPLLRQAGGGAIVNLSSAAGRLGFALRSPYSASKWAVIGFTKSLALELGPDNIRVNAILPGAVDGPRIRRVIEAKAQAMGVPFAAMLARYQEQSSLKRMVTEDDVAAMVLYLCSPAGRNISGQMMNVDGDTQALV